MYKDLTVKINIKLQEAADEDMKDVFDNLGSYEFTIGVEEDREGWDEFVARTIAEGPPEYLEEEA